MEDLNLEVFKKQIKNTYISCECRYEFNGRKCNLRQKWNKDKYQCECRKPITHQTCEKRLFLES